MQGAYEDRNARSKRIEPVEIMRVQGRSNREIGDIIYFRDKVQQRTCHTGSLRCIDKCLQSVRGMVSSGFGYAFDEVYLQWSCIGMYFRPPWM